MKDTKQILTEALAHLEADGWAQGQYEGPGGCLCSVGAVLKVIHDDPRRDEHTDSFETAEAALRAGAGIQTPVWLYNDHPERTFEEIRQMFTNAIELVSAE
ncbi:hypothetical protein SEA_STEPHIG9_44 [Mycobacterium phage Stephig9]|uniref:Uncharacterized protein n=1 Tax=Mycobacterium phage Stephig9 TaxID=2591224 RepID=A0A514DHC0_9CAUD|nr:hypothetical protein SEA_STEPHIG9_44 [Mycobacterium phage Stephig9]